MPVAVFGAALHNNARHLPQALDSLLSQTERDLAVVLVDDASTDGTAEVVSSYAADPRVGYERNPVRLGLIRTWRRALELARRRHPRAEYFAWASDHDVWDHRWLERMLAELDGHPQAVLAYPLAQRIGELGQPLRPGPPWRFDTAGIADPRRRFARFCRAGVSGDMVYGLFRAGPLESLGFPSALMPDRLLLARLSLAGEFRQVPELLWRRRYVLAVTARRQRGSLFAGRGSPSTLLPWPLAHSMALARELSIDAAVRPAVGRWAGLWLAAVYLASSTWRQARKQLLRPVSGLRLRERRAFRAAVGAVRGAGGRRWSH
ncbi:MAG TPA: glycosyltransferase family A protein [Solirubrobacteraceae bacterium]|nr:glycosyltransferase family A protein [Solirubrobacteraceae bacterium]